MNFKHPSTFLIAGPTQSGKTYFVKRLLENQLFEPKPDRIIWAYGEWQPSYDKMKSSIPNLEFIKGLNQNTFQQISPDLNNILVIDDLMSEGGKSDIISDLFTRGSHHRNLSVIYLVQNIFHKGKNHRSCSLNSHYIVLFKNPRDRAQISTLGRQMYPNSKNFLAAALDDACLEQSYGYLVLDLRNDTSEDYRVRTNIFPGEQQIVYKPVDC